MNKEARTLDNVVEEIKRIVGLHPSEWMPTLIEALQTAEHLLPEYSKIALEASYLPSHGQYCFDKQRCRYSKYSLSGFLEMIVTLCQT